MRPQGPLRTSIWVAAQLGVSRFTALRLLQSGELPAVDIAIPGHRRSRLRVYEGDFYAWLDSRKLPTDGRRKVPA